MWHLICFVIRYYIFYPLFYTLRTISSYYPLYNYYVLDTVYICSMWWTIEYILQTRCYVLCRLHTTSYITYYILGHGPGPLAQGPRYGVQLEIRFYCFVNLWNPGYYKLSTILDRLYIWDYANYILYIIWHILDIINYRIKIRY